MSWGLGAARGSCASRTRGSRSCLPLPRLQEASDERDGRKSSSSRRDRESGSSQTGGGAGGLVWWLTEVLCGENGVFGAFCGVCSLIHGAGRPVLVPHVADSLLLKAETVLSPLRQ